MNDMNEKAFLEAEVRREEYQSYSAGADGDGAGRRLSVTGRRISVVDDVFGQIVEGGPNYRNVGTAYQVTMYLSLTNPC